MNDSKHQSKDEIINDLQMKIIKYEKLLKSKNKELISLNSIINKNLEREKIQTPKNKEKIEYYTIDSSEIEDLKLKEIKENYEKDIRKKK